jgi:hypothetical protein
MQKNMRPFTCYDGSNRVNWLPQADFAYNASRALGIEHTPFERSFGFSPPEPPDMLYPIRPPVHGSSTAQDRLRHNKNVTTFTCFLRLHKDKMQACSQASIALQFEPRDKVSVVTKSLF